MGLSTEIIYPFFIELSKYTDDVFWATLCRDLAQSNAPYGIYIDSTQELLFGTSRGNLLQFSFRDAIANEETLTYWLEFMRGLGIQSNQERYDALQRAQQTHVYTQWNDIKKKYVRELLLHTYVIDLKRKYNLTNQQMRVIGHELLVWFQFKLLTKHDVEFDPRIGRITQIRDLYIKNGKIRLARDLKNMLE